MTVLLTQPGCKTVARENILSTINTGMGLTVTENPTTQLYELKAGFIRTQFYSVPTGKNVEGAETSKVVENGKVTTSSTNLSNNARSTPNVVSGIRARSSAKDLFLGMDISENFAVGDDAVRSPAAVAMYIAEAAATNNAAFAAEAVSYTTQSPLESGELAPEARETLAHLATVYQELPKRRTDFDAAAQGVGYTNFPRFSAGRPKEPSLAQIRTVTKALESEPEIKQKLDEVRSRKSN